MSIDIAASLNEHQRNALLSYYLGQYVPESDNTDLINLVQTPEDVYEYLLIDPLVSHSVTTSRVAQAMSSIQQYINGIAMNMEPGYNTRSLDADQVTLWNEGASQYSFWGGEVDLDTYPENYLDPTLRQNQTAWFKDLINDLNQNTITDNTAQQSVMNYLNKFEQVANLDIVSGYLNSTDQTLGIYYLLGKSNTSPVQYYWRSFDMSQNVDNVVASRAWSEWFPMNICINEKAAIGTPRLAYFNNRLYLFWFEKTTGGSIEKNDSVETYDVITAYSSYCDFSNNWSSPYTLMTIDNIDPNDYCNSLFDSEWLCTACGYNKNEGIITVSLYAGDNVSSADSEVAGYSDLSIEIDYWFNLTRVYSKSDSDTPTTLSQYLFYYLQNDVLTDNQERIQSQYVIGLPVLDHVTLLPRTDEGQFINCDFTLPSLSKENFSLVYNSDGSYVLHGEIPQSVTTHKYYQYFSDAMMNGDGTQSLDGQVSVDMYWSDYGSEQLVQLKNTIVTCSNDGGNINAVHFIDTYNLQDVYNLSKTYSYQNGGYDISAECYPLYVTTYDYPYKMYFSYSENQYQYDYAFYFTLDSSSQGVVSPWTFAAWPGGASLSWGRENDRGWVYPGWCSAGVYGSVSCQCRRGQRLAGQR
ncbi:MULTISPECIES: neuraminidase-like domain-containing protein [unclassified Leclercia]|uniref:neuraminidase-like domain-containing protein n=1 Tax=Leclercia TaxID=83654 RepID=UPI00207405CE|nr:MULTISPECIES: neuraminidase-like domain-containing protein [unclassified Leclercia]MCM5697024.1 hypothetical protein [Leclercia sp. LTM01]